MLSGQTPPCGAEPRIELGPALQQADALPTEPRRTNVPEFHLAEGSDPYSQDWRLQGYDPGVPGRAAGGDRCAGRPRLPRARLSGTQARRNFTIFSSVADP